MPNPSQNINKSHILSLDSDNLDLEKILSSYDNFNVDKEFSYLSHFEENQFKLQSLDPINFNIIIVGEKGIGKTSFIKSFIQKLNKSHKSECISKIEIVPHKQSYSHDFVTYSYSSKLEEENFNIEIIECEGYRNNLKIKDWMEKINSFLKERVIPF